MPRQSQIRNLPLGGPGWSGIPQPYMVPIVANYAPTTLDRGDSLGQIWVYLNGASSAAYVLVYQQAGVSTWVTTAGGSSGAGTFTSITNSGATTLSALGRGVVESSSTGLLSSQALNNGQIIIGSTGAAPVAATILGGPGIQVINGAGTITIQETGSGVAWNSVTVSGPVLANNGYMYTGIVNSTFTLPLAATIGDTIDFIQAGTNAASQITIQANGGTSTITFGTIQSSSNGTLISPAYGSGTGTTQSSISLVAQATAASNVQWQAFSAIGTWTKS